MDEGTLMEFVGKFAGDLGATMAAGNVVVGDRLGLYRALAAGPQRPAELAEATGTDPRYVEEWLRGQAAGGYVTYDADAATYSLTEEQAFALTDPDGPIYLPGAFELALGSLRATPRVVEAFRTGDGIGWHEHDDMVFSGCERFFRPGYLMHLVPEWLPALDGVVDKLNAGARVVDLGCGHGASTVLLAQAFPASTFVGSDYHEGSIEEARKRAAEAGVSDRVRFEVATCAEHRRARRRPGRDLRLPARHGRPARGGPADQVDPGSRRHLADRRAEGGRHGRGEPQPARPGLLRLLDVPLRAERDVPVRWLRARRAGRRGGDPAGRDRRRLHPVPPGAETLLNLVYEARP